MPIDAKRPPITGQTVSTPKAPVRSKQGPYLTPRLAGSPRSTVSPELRKDNRPTLNTASKAAPKNDISTPVMNFLSSNVTPRSGSRKARVDSANTTPNSTPGGTPASSRPTSVVVARENNDDAQGLGINTGVVPQHVRSGSVVSNGTSPTITRRVSPEIDSPMFFHASDASSMPKKQPQPISNCAGFIYADGRKESTSRPKSLVGTSKFRHAKGSPDSPTVSKSPISPITSPSYPPRGSSLQLDQPRSTSPLKESELPRRPGFGGRRPSNTSAASLRSSTKAGSLPQARPVASQVKMGNCHSKIQSTSSFEPEPPPVPSNGPLVSAVQPQPLPDKNVALPSLKLQTQHAPQNVTSPTSPTIPSRTQIQLEQLYAVAANARQARKVLDLEISNSSLLAINRTLEREFRKQSAEIRRYRRLTRAGRLSLVPTANDRAISGTTTISTLSLDSQAGYSSDTDDLDEDDDNELLLSDHIGQSSDEESERDLEYLLSLSPAARAARDARQQARAEKRLQLDLTKYQQLLTASSAMNVSLKRCIGWTEELILEGKKALEYTVRPSEVDIGGRVLRADNVDEDHALAATKGSKALLSPTRVFTAEGMSDPEILGELGTGNLAGSLGGGEDIRGPYGAAIAEEEKEFREHLESIGGT